MPNDLGAVWVSKESEFTEDDKKENGNKQVRCFNKIWFTKFEWLTYHRIKRPVFCKYCTEMKNQTPFSYFESAAGFSNFKKGCKRRKDHEKSDDHGASVRELRHRESMDQDVHAQINSQHREQQKLRMLGLNAHLCTMKTLLQ